MDYQVGDPEVAVLGRSHGQTANPAEAPAKPPPTVLRLEAVKKNADIWLLIWCDT
jgi:hypothetical protein